MPSREFKKALGESRGFFVGGEGEEGIEAGGIEARGGVQHQEREEGEIFGR